MLLKLPLIMSLHVMESPVLPNEIEIAPRTKLAIADKIKMLGGEEINVS